MLLCLLSAPALLSASALLSNPAWSENVASVEISLGQSVRVVDGTTIHIGQSWRVVDGDTIHIDSYKIRLLGMDAPEIRQSCQTSGGHDWACGVMARDSLKAMLESHNQELVCQINGKDRYKRDLGSCYIGSIETGINVQRMLIRAGLAVAEYGNQYNSDEKYAAREMRGMWAGSFSRPKDWRKAQKNN
tara:strand:- start:1934 stop:2500 length:567 start_codon:yes stop_codon:yes gene_type:complete